MMNKNLISKLNLTDKTVGTQTSPLFTKKINEGIGRAGHITKFSAPSRPNGTRSIARQDCPSSATSSVLGLKEKR